MNNSATIQGGNGGNPGYGGYGPNGAGAYGAAGAGGAGVMGSGISVTNSGTISGGLSGYGARADAIQFTGGNNTLSLLAGSILTGNLGLSGGARLTFDQATDQSLSNTITGDGSIIQNGLGTLTLTGVNTYTGGTTLQAGTLAIGDDSQLGAPSRGLTFDGGKLEMTHGITTSRGVALNAGGGTIQVNSGFSSTLSGIIADGTGAGMLVKTGAGTLTLNAANTYTGGTAVRSGVVNVAGGATLGSSGSVVVGNALGGDLATLAFKDGSSAKGLSITNNETGTTTFIGAVATDATTSLVNAGTLDMSGATTDLKFGSLSGAGAVNYGNQVLTIGKAGGTDTIGGAISGAGGLVKTGTNVLILDGVNTYTGRTTIDDGTLEVGDINTPGASVAGNVQVNAGGTLRGHGTVSGDVNNTGTVRPGGSIGTLTVLGNYTQSPGSTLMIDVSPTAASQLKVGGTASLNGTLSLLYGPGTYTTQTYRIVQANAVTGGFTTVTGNTPSGVTQNVITSADAVDLALTGAGSSSVVIAPTNAALFGAAGSAVLREGQRVNDGLLDRLSRPCLSANGQACAQPNRDVWIQASGTDTRIDGNHGAPDARDQRYGFMAGADRQWKGWTVGLAAGYSHSDVKEDGTGARGVLDTLRLAGYAGRDVGPVSLAGTVGYGYDFLSTTRPFGAFGSTEGDGYGQEFNTGVQASAPWTVGPIVLTPRAGVRYTHLDGLGLNETGPTSQNLRVADQGLDSLQPYMGVTLDYPFQTSSERSGSFQARVGYANETQSVNRAIRVTAADGTGFEVPGTTDSRGMVTTGGGVTLPIGKAANAYVRYDALMHTGNVSAQSLQAGVDYRF